MGINLGTGFGNLNGNTNNTNQTSGMILNLNKNDILDLTKKNPGLRNVKLGAGWDISTNGSDFDLDIAAFLLDRNNKFNDVSNVIFFNNKQGQGIALGGDNRTGAGDGDDEKISVDLDKLPSKCDKVIFALNIYDAVSRKQNFSKIKQDKYLLKFLPV